jgi:hypothetical protein
MTSRVSVGVSGHSFQVEETADLKIFRRVGYGLILGAQGKTAIPAADPFTWVHAAIPLLTMGADVPTKSMFAVLTQVRVAFTADDMVMVTNLHIWHGEDRVAAFDGLRSEGPLLEQPVDPITLSPPRALGLSFGMWFPTIIDEYPPGAGMNWGKITFHWARADFELGTAASGKVKPGHPAVIRQPSPPGAGSDR